MKKPQRIELYRKQLLDITPSLLANLNRDPYTLTYGCFDREHWAWGNKDFSDTDFQRALYPLTHLYLTEFPKNIYYDNISLLTWICAGLEYWADSQHKNGSFDQWYPWEQSVGTAAFTLYPLSEIVLKLGKKIPAVLGDKLYTVIKRAADFICSEPESHGFISNHQAGMAIALVNASKILDDKKYLIKAQSIINHISEKQSSEGWFSEYNGADPGYESLGISYLAGYYKRTQDPTVLEMIRSAIEFYISFVHPDGTVGGEYGSRNTELFFPAGFEIILKQIPEAQAVLEKIVPSIADDKIPAPATIDFFNMVPILDNYTVALESCLEDDFEHDEAPLLPCEQGEDSMKFFSESQLTVVNRKNYYAVAGLSKGGVLKIYDKAVGKLVYDNCGIYARLSSGKDITSQMLNYDRKIENKDDIISIESPLYFNKQRSMNPFSFMIFRIGTMTAGLVGPLNRLIKWVMAKMLITTVKKSPAEYSRKITFSVEKVVVEDTIRMNGAKFAWFKAGEKFVTTFMGSARYFQKSELGKPSPIVSTPSCMLGQDDSTIKDTIFWKSEGQTSCKREFI